MKTPKKICWLGLVVLGFELLFNLNFTPAVSAAPVPKIASQSWQKKEVKDCFISDLSVYHPDQAFCYSLDNRASRQFKYLSLNNPANRSATIFSDSFFFHYEDPQTGSIYFLSIPGEFFRIDPPYDANSYHTIIPRGPNNYITSSLMRSAGPGTGVLLFRWSNLSYWFGSYDNGQTWQPRFTDQDRFDNASLYDIQFSAANPAIAYGLSQAVAEPLPQGGYRLYYYLYKSTDMARTFKRIYQTPAFISNDKENSLAYQLIVPTSPAYDENTVYLQRFTDEGTNRKAYHYYRSLDGGSSFSEIGTAEQGYILNPNFYPAADGALLQAATVNCDSTRKCQLLKAATRSIDQGATFQALGEVPGYYIERFFLPTQNSQVYYALARPLNPSNPATSHSRLLRSTSGGVSWELLPESDGPNLDSQDYYNNPRIQLTDYSPLSLVVTDPSNRPDTKLYIWQDEAADRLQTRATGPKPAQHYFEATHHNLRLFEDYWSKNGGLAQFGYPQTEVFREVNPSDGHIYDVQYFERNRFEYHPENKGSSYEVLLGLLGNQLTEERRARGEGAFNHFDNQHYPGGLYFPETGHNLRNSFLAYWQQNGGLASYGYPISEEFNEVNPDDGKSYIVQYFERARFEYHPENRGSRYEVLLGLLGNTLLKQKDWLQ